MECSQHSAIASIWHWCLISGNLLSKKNHPLAHSSSFKDTCTQTSTHSNSELTLMLCCRRNSKINVGVAPDADSCNNNFSYDLFSLFTHKHRNSNIKAVAETISLAVKLRESHMLEEENTQIFNSQGVPIHCDFKQWCHISWSTNSTYQQVSKSKPLERVLLKQKSISKF